MPRKRTGSVTYVEAKRPGEKGFYRVRITLPDGKRTRIDLDPGPKSPAAEARAKERAASYSEQVVLRGIVAVPRRPGVARATREEDSSSMAKWFETWCAIRTAKGLTSVKENEAHWRVHLQPLLGGHVKDWVPDDIRAVSRTLDEKVAFGELKWKSAINTFGTLSKMCSDAVRSKHDKIRCRTDNPALGVAGPDRGVRTAKQFLHPNELLRFVACERVPMQWRRLVAILTYLYCRPGELRELHWDAIDLEHGQVHIHQATSRVDGLAKSTKTGTTRRFNIEPNLVPLLKQMHEECGGRGRVIEMPSDRDLARAFRTWLAHAKVDRVELHQATPTRKAITCYDLRATGITWCAIRGDEPLRIMQRAGHAAFGTTMGYIREAENLREGFGDVFPPLPLKALGVPEKGPGPVDPVSAAAPAPEPETASEKALADSKEPIGLIFQRRGRDSNPGKNAPITGNSSAVRSDQETVEPKDMPSKASDRHGSGPNVAETTVASVDLARTAALALCINALAAIGDVERVRSMSLELAGILQAAAGAGATVVPIAARRRSGQH